jgi:hypothetical protein
MDSLFFDDSPEPDRFYYDTMMYEMDKAKMEGKTCVGFEFATPDEFYEAVMSMNKFTDDSIVVSGTSREGAYEMILTEAVDLDDDSAPSIDRDAKKKTKAEKEEAARQKEIEAQRMLELEKEKYSMSDIDDDEYEYDDYDE